VENELIRRDRIHELEGEDRCVKREENANYAVRLVLVK
jgi:hypothetical protein